MRQLAGGRERNVYKSAHSELNERECISLAREDKLEWEKRGNKVIPVCALFLARISAGKREKRKEARQCARIIAIKKTPEGIFIIPKRASERANPLPA